MELPLFTTTRLTMRPFMIEDAPFTLALLNDPGFLKNIGDRKIRTLEKTEDYIRDRLISSYLNYGYGLYHLSANGIPVGMCGLVKRDYLAFPDIGFGLMTSFLNQGFGFESAQVFVTHAREVLKLPTLYGLTSLQNEISMRLLEKLGLSYESTIESTPGETSRLYSIHFEKER